MESKKIFKIEFPYWVRKKIIITLGKIYNEEKYVYRLGIWKSEKLGVEWGSCAGDWGLKWWTFFDIWKGKIR